MKDKGVKHKRKPRRCVFRVTQDYIDAVSGYTAFTELGKIFAKAIDEEILNEIRSNSK